MEQPGFFAVIPSAVRYDKRLKANEKLLYGEITALTNTTGYCFANNPYFAELYDVSSETVSRWISNLKKCGYIRIDIGDNGENRKIFIEDISAVKTDPLTKTSNPLDENVNPPLDENVKHNNTSINNKYNNIFDFWNSLKICVHKKLTPDLIKAIDSAIKKSGYENILLAIKRYGQAYYDSKFYYNNKWALLNFLKQKNGYLNWLDDGQIWINYQPSAEISKPKQVPNADETDRELDEIWGDDGT